MPWFKIDDKMTTHPKVFRIPRATRLAAIGLWAAGGVWCAAHLTDGRLPAYMVDELGGTPELADALVGAGLWEADGSDFRFHDWSDYQPTREHVENERAAARERMANRRRTTTDVPPNTDGTSTEVRRPRPDPTRPDQKTTPPSGGPLGVEPRNAPAGRVGAAPRGRRRDARRVPVARPPRRARPVHRPLAVRHPVGDKTRLARRLAELGPGGRPPLRTPHHRPPDQLGRRVRR